MRLTTSLTFFLITFMGPCIVIIFYYINPNKMNMLQSLFYLTTALRVSGVTITHLQDQINTPPTTHSNKFQLFHDSSRKQYEYVPHSLFYRTY